ncbi:mRNA turnover and ribosome assembly protein [Tilletia horrida]|nr:mRNA turnover and ribosome assembly protein [Tilletia horrida]
MPKTKRNKVVSLTKTTRKTREHKTGLIDRVREAAESFPYIWIIRIEANRATFLQEVRDLWKGSKIFYGKLKVLSLALGDSEESEVRQGLSGISKRLAGHVGLLMTESSPAEVQEWFATHSRQAYSRGGNKATEDVILPEGPVMIRTDPPETLPHNMEPQLRALGMPTELRRGVPTLLREYTVCKKGQTLTAESAQILKHLIIQMSNFHIVPLAYWSAATSSITEINGGISIREKNQSKARKSGKDADMEEDEDDEDEEGEDDDDEEIEEDEEAEAVGAGDKVTSSMMLPAGLA